MKKIKIFLVFILSLFFINNAFSYSLDFSGKWFYSNISSNTSDVNWKMFTIESQNNWWLKQKINEKIWQECIVRDLTESEFYEIAVKWKINFLNSFLWENCLKNWSIDQALQNRIISAIQEVYNETKKTSENKTDKLLNFSNIWIYSDWIEGNWPFDLMIDFEEIDKILFIQDETKNSFESWNEVNLAEKIDWLLNKLKKNNSSNTSQNNSNNIFWTNNNSENKNNLSLCSLDWNCDNYTEVQKLLCEINWNCNWQESHGFLSLKNDFTCKVDNSWLNKVSSKIITSTLNSDNTKKTSENNSNNSQNQANSWNIWNSTNIYTSVPNPMGNYNKIDDNKQFPCGDFFCIDIKFKTYNFNLNPGNDDPSIEFLINRSNNHLKKFMATSLAQAKMTTNNFELNLKDLDLPNMFHMWVQISYEPVPILKIDNSETDKEDKWETKLDSQLEKYYKANGLDYKLRNDLSAFSNIEKEKQIVSNANSTTVTEAWNKYADLAYERDKLLDSLNSMQNLIEEKVKFERLDSIEKKLIEMERFNSWINSYIVNLETILNEIKKIPIDKNKN